MARRRWTAFILAALVLLGTLGGLGGYAALKPPPEVLESLEVEPETVEDWSRVIAYVPLDDRTDNLEDAVYLAEASGWRVVLPPKDWYHTALDGQAPNANGTPYGDRGAIFAWVRDMDARGCDRFLLSLDQLFSGGLVNSRSIGGPQAIPFPDGAVLDETGAFETYLLPLAEDPANRVYLFDSVVRLSPTVGYLGFGEAEYYGLREYGMVPRPALAEADLTLENVFARYPYAADGVTPAEDALGSDKFRHTLTPERLEAYLNVRRRKLTLLDQVIDRVSALPGDTFQLLIGIDDSSNTENIQYNELRYLKKRLGPGTALIAGLDSLSRLLIGRLAQEEYGYQVRAAVRYVGGTEGRPSSEFDLYTLQEVVDLHIDFFRAVIVPPEEAELQIVVMAAPAEPDRAAEYREELLSILEENLAHHIPTVLDEASNNAYGDALEQALLNRIPFGQLVAYAGKYDQANVTGAAMAMGFSRYLYLRCREDREDAAQTAQVKQIANSMALTEYILHTRTPLNEYVQSMGLNRNNLLPNPVQTLRIRWKLQSLFAPECRKVRENLRGSPLLTGVDPWQEGTIQDVRIVSPYFPWHRTFELSFTVKASL